MEGTGQNEVISVYLFIQMNFLKYSSVLVNLAENVLFTSRRSVIVATRLSWAVLSTQFSSHSGNMHNDVSFLFRSLCKTIISNTSLFCSFQLSFFNSSFDKVNLSRLDCLNRAASVFRQRTLSTVTQAYSSFAYLQFSIKRTDMLCAAFIERK